MSNPGLRLRGPQTARLSPYYQMPLGRILVETGVLTNAELLDALALQNQCSAPLSQICLAEGFATAPQILQAQSLQWAAISLGYSENPPDSACSNSLDPLFCLEHGIVPWMRLGDTLVIATSRPEEFEALLSHLPESKGQVVMGIASEGDIHAAIAGAHQSQLTLLAETTLPEEESCRGLHVIATQRQMVIAALLAVLAGGMLFAFPSLFYGLAAGWAVFTLFCVALMKGAACFARLYRPAETVERNPSAGDSNGKPRVSILVPLYKERDIATKLVTRLSRLTYSKTLLDIVLVLEETDAQTQETLAQTDLPPWMRTIVVPKGSLTTKPRAMNYALRFCRGDIIGIYDAEDNPAPDQIEAVVDRFAHAPAETVCLQGILDYYNPRANWLARCFTIEYASWFRVILPGLARLGFAIPLGGTTVFFRRHALEKLGGWDAHNVTEDADLGMRLARHGYRTEMLDTVTLEEANCRWWPWIRQRSRWLKGYMATYRVHMRNPAKLLKQLGTKRFIGFQIFFLGSLSQFVLAPVLWSFWLVLFGFSHPLDGWIFPSVIMFIASLFFLTEALALIVGAASVASPRHRHLLPWVPTMMFYFPLGVAAAYKALLELVSRPFYWDKTDHGHSLGTDTLEHAEHD